VIFRGALAFSCDAPGPPWRMLAGIFFEVDTRVLLTVLLITLMSCVLFGVCALPLLVELLQLWAFPCLMDLRPLLVPAALANAIVRRN
jgi:hypothetical protein